MKNFTIESFDGTPLYCYLFDEVENPKAVVMVVHGMGEHMGRYKAFSEYLNKAGYLVFGDVGVGACVRTGHGDDGVVHRRIFAHAKVGIANESKEQDDDGQYR